MIGCRFAAVSFCAVVPYEDTPIPFSFNASILSNFLSLVKLLRRVTPLDVFAVRDRTGRVRGA